MNLLSSKTNSQGTVKTRYFLLYLARVHERRFLCVLVLCVRNGNTVAGQHGTRDERGMLRHVPVEFKPEISRYSKTRYFLLYLACVHERRFLCVLVLCVRNGNTVAGQHGTRDERGMLRHVLVEFKPENSRYSTIEVLVTVPCACARELFFKVFKGPLSVGVRML